MCPMNPFQRVVQSRNQQSQQRNQSRSNLGYAQRQGIYYPPPPAPPVSIPPPSTAQQDKLDRLLNLPESDSTEYILAWKGAAIIDWNAYPPQFHGLFHGIYKVDDVAICEAYYGAHSASDYYGAHSAPHIICCCGFYGVKDWKKLDYQDRTKYYMEVEFYGKIIVCEKGYRAEKQRILAIYCTSAGIIEARCYLDKDDVMTEEVLFATMSNLLGIEVRKYDELPGNNP